MANAIVQQSERIKGMVLAARQQRVANASGQRDCSPVRALANAIVRRSERTANAAANAIAH
eukprot:8199241-Alexandrium_andersonii.AAC.1